MFEKITLRGLLVLLLTLLLINVVAVSIGSEESSLTVANHTQHYLHIFIDGDPFLYVAPERSVTYVSAPKPDILVTAIYSPGQGIHGSLSDTVTVPYRGATEACSCEEDDQWGDWRRRGRPGPTRSRSSPPTSGSAGAWRR